MYQMAVLSHHKGILRAGEGQEEEASPHPCPTLQSTMSFTLLGLQSPYFQLHLLALSQEALIHFLLFLPSTQTNEDQLHFRSLLSFISNTLFGYWVVSVVVIL